MSKMKKFKIKKGSEVFNITESSYSEYEAGLYSLGQEVRGMLRRHLYISRLMMKLPISPKLNELPTDFDYIQRLELVALLTEANGLSMRKLIENNRNSWNFLKLFDQIKNRINTRKVEELEGKINEFRERWAEYKIFGDRVAAHLSKSIEPLAKLILVNLEHSVLHAMNLLDEFVEGEIPYKIETKTQEKDLREFTIGLADSSIRHIASTPFDQRPPMRLPKKKQ